jgi:lysophospholipase L1-like esterase
LLAAFFRGHAIVTKSSSFRARLFSTILLLVSVTLSLWLVELGLRLYFHGRVFNGVADSAGQMLHATRGTANTPNSEMGMQKLAFVATAHINSRGIRGAEIAQEPAPGVTRILLVSDSGSFGSGVNDGENIADQMQAILGKDKYEVVNFSVAAYSTVQEYVWLVEEGLALKPKLVILGFAPGNDIQTNYLPLQKVFQNDTKRPYAELDGKGGFNVSYDAMKQSQERRSKGKWKNAVLGFFVGTLTQRLVGQASEMFGGGRKTDPNIWIGWPFIDGFSMDDAEAGRTEADYQKLWTDAWDVSKAVVRGMRDKTEAAGAKFVMYAYVNKMQGNPDYLAAVQATYPKLKLNMQKPETMFSDFGKEAGIPVISMYQAIMAEAAKGDRAIYFGVDDEHMTAHGHHLAAEALVDALKKQGLL